MARRLGNIIKELNIGLSTAVEFLQKKNDPVDETKGVSVKLTDSQETLLMKEFSSDKNLKEKSEKQTKERQHKDNSTIDIESKKAAKKAAKQQKKAVEPIEEEVIEVLPDTDAVEELAEISTPNIEEQVEPETTTTELYEEPIEEVQGIYQSEMADDTNSLQQEAIDKEAELAEIPVSEANNISLSEEITEIKNDLVEENIATQSAENEIVEDDYETEDETSDSEESIDTVEANTEKKVEIFRPNETRLDGPKVLGKVDLSSMNQSNRPKKESRKERKRRQEEEKRQREERLKNNAQKPTQKTDKNAQKPNAEGQKKEQQGRKAEFIETKVPTLKGPKIVDKLNLETEKNKHKESDNRKESGKNSSNSDSKQHDKKKRDRIKAERIELSEDRGQHGKFNKKDKRGKNRPVIDEEDVAQSVKETLALAREGRKFNKKAVDYRKEKRENIRQEMERQAEMEAAQSKILKLTEFVTANELATMMKVPVNDVIKVYMNLGMFVGINQRLDADTINLVADEFGFETEFVSADAAKAIVDDEIDNEEDLIHRPPIVTVMGHVDHGKTSLLDYIRKTNVIAGEAGGITQHIGAYNVKLEDGQQITFIDTPGHEAFTAMRARGAKVTDIAIIVVAADDNVMPQTIEAINHASSAGVPIVFAINKIDKDGADPERIKAELANMNYMVESWGGKYQSQDISAKKGIGIKELLEKVLLESELLELKANPKRRASGSVIDVRKDKGRGNEITLLVQNGTLKHGDIVIAGYAYGRVRAMFNERNQPIKHAKPSEPVLVLGMKGELQAGDNFNVMQSEQEAREIISERNQLKREQSLRTTSHLTLDEIGRRIALGSFQELNLIVKGDVDGSIEALSDSLIKLSTPEIQVNVIHKGIGQITEGDVNLAISSNAIIIGFQVRPTTSAKHLADTEKVDIRIYSIIYQAIDEVKAAMEGMLIPDKAEKVVATLEVRDTFHISKVGTIAGCFVREGLIKRTHRVRLIHDGIVVHTGEISSLKHLKDDAKEIKQGYECGLSLATYNDISVGDIIEAFEEIEIKKTLN